MSNVINEFKKAESKTEKFSVEAIIKKMDKHTIRFDHPAQRCSDQWTNKMKGNLISDIIQDNPIPPIILAQQFMNGVSITWNLDGKQRCTTVYQYVHNQFKISKQVRRSLIRYQAPVCDKDGNPILDDKMVPVMEVKEFNIANKTFDQLPEELQEAILEYGFNTVLYLDCSSEDIVYHIARYNDGKPMNKTQKGTVNLGEDFANEVKNIADHSFFIDFADFGKAGKNNGNIDRCICESIMATKHMDNWTGNNFEAMCSYLKENADISEFEDVEDSLDRLDEVLDGSNEELFTSKESFIWITVFNKFKTLGIDDEKFAEFLTNFINNEMGNVEINGATYNELEGNKSTKDKGLVTKKINHLIALMNNYFGIVEDSAA